MITNIPFSHHSASIHYAVSNYDAANTLVNRVGLDSFSDYAAPYNKTCIQSDSEGNANRLGGDSIGICKKKFNMHMCLFFE